jgi:HrpA-like RNA helicase
MHEAGSKAFKLILVSATLGNIKNDLQKYFQNAEFIECNALTHTNIPETISNV